jgi:hypothetical protein
MFTPIVSIPAAIRDRISAPAQPRVWTPEDFADLGPRTAVDQALHRLVASRSLRRIARGFYDAPQDNRLTGKPTYPNPRDVIDALARKGKVRVVVDGLTAANDLGLTDAVPACSPMAACGPSHSATLLSTSRPQRPAAFIGRAAPPCASCRRSIGCATCFRPTMGASANALSPSSETPIMDRPFRTTCAAACRRCRSGCG